jgi:hypothetical protein
MTDLDFQTMFEQEGEDVSPDMPEQQEEDFQTFFEAEGEDLGIAQYSEEEQELDKRHLEETGEQRKSFTQEWERYGSLDAYYKHLDDVDVLSTGPDAARQEAERLEKLLQHRIYDDFNNLWKTEGQEWADDMRAELDELGLPTVPHTMDEMREVTKVITQVAMTGMIVYAVGAPALAAYAAGGLSLSILTGLGAAIESGIGIAAFMKSLQGLDYLVRRVKGYDHVEGVERGFMDLLDTTHMADSTLFYLETAEEALKLVAFGMLHKGAKKAGHKVVPHSTRVKIAEGLFRDVTRLHAPDKAIMNIKAEELMASLHILDIKNIDPKAKAALQLMGISPMELALRQKFSLDVQVPSEKILVLKDKPFWAKLKQKIRLSPYEQRRVEPFTAEGKTAEGVEGVESEPFQTDGETKIPIDEDLKPEYTAHERDGLSTLEDKHTIGEIEAKAQDPTEGLEFKQVEPEVGKGEAKAVPEFGVEKVETITLGEAIDTGVIDKPTGELIQAIMREFPDAWQEHFDVAISNQEFRPTAEQLGEHGVPKRQHQDMRMHGALLTEKMGPLLEDARHIAVIFKDGNIGTFFHEFGHFVEKRLLSNSDRAIVNKAYEAYKKAGAPTGKLKTKEEFFADEFKDWWMRGLWEGKIRNVQNRNLANIFRNTLRAAKNIWRALRGRGEKGPMDAFFEDIITNGRELNEKLYFSEQEMTARYVTGVEPDAKQIRDQGLHSNQKTELSFDPSTICPKQRAFVEFILKHARENDMSEADLADNQLLATFYDAALLEGIDVPCKYCYVEEARAEAIRFHREGKSLQQVLGAKAKPVVQSVPYVDKILDYTDAEIAEFNKRGGVRMFSFSDYVREFNRAEVSTFLAHCKQRGLSVKAITKRPEFVEDFADTGIIINLSIDYQAKGGPAVDWDVAIALSKKYPNVKIRTVARNPKELEWFLTTDEIKVDVVTPFHGKNHGEFVDMSGNSVGAKKVRALVEERPEYAERICCLVGGRCFSEKHQKQCASNCGNLEGNLSIPADIGNVRELKPSLEEDIPMIVGRHSQEAYQQGKFRQDGMGIQYDPEQVSAQRGWERKVDRDDISAVLDDLGYNLDRVAGDPGVEARLNSRDWDIMKEVTYSRFVKAFKKDLRVLLAQRKIAATAEVRKNIDTFEPFATVKRLSYNPKNNRPTGISEDALFEMFDLSTVEQLKTRYPGLIKETVQTKGGKQRRGSTKDLDVLAQENGFEDAEALVHTLLTALDKDSRVRLETDNILKMQVGESAHPTRKAKASQTYKWTKELTRDLRKKFNVTVKDVENLMEMELRVLLEEYFEFGEDVLPEVQEAPYNPATRPKELEPQYLDQVAREEARAKTEAAKLAAETKKADPKYEPEIEEEFAGKKEALRRRISARSKELAEEHARLVVEKIEADIGKVDYEAEMKITEDKMEVLEAEMVKDQIRGRRSYKTGNLLRTIRAWEKRFEKIKMRNLEARARAERRKIHADIVRWSEMKTIHPEARKVLAEMAGGIDPVARRTKTARKVESTLAFINEAREMGEDIPWEHDWFVRVMQDPIDTLFMADMRAMHDVAKNVAHLGKLKQRLISSKIQRDFAKSQKIRNDSILYHNKITPDPVGKDAIEPQAELLAPLTDIMLKWGADLKKVEYTMRHVDGRQDGPNQEMIEWQVAADNRKILISEKIFGKLDSLFTDNKLGRKWAKTKTMVRGVGMISNIKRVAIALHSKAKGNREAMLGNKVYQFTPEILDNNLADLSPAEVKLVEGIWELFEKDVWPLLAEAHVKMTGVEPEFVDGYYPLNFDGKLAVQSKIMQEVNVQRESLFYNRKVNDRMTIARKDGMLPPDLGMDALHRSLTDSIHYITHSAVGRDMNKVLSDPIYRRNFTKATSEHHWRELENHVKQMISPHMSENKGGFYDSNVFGKIRRNYTLYALGLNIAVGAKQLLSISNLIASREVGAKAVAKAFARYLKNPVEAHRYVNEMSPEMMVRGRQGIYRDLHQKLNVTLEPHRHQLGRYYDTFRTFTMTLIKLNDKFATTVSYLAGENAALAKGGSKIDGLIGGNRAVRRTQPSAQARDLPPISRKGEISKAISMFYSFLSVVYNMNSEAFHGLVKDKRLGHFMAALMFVNILPGIAAKQIDVGTREHRVLTPGEALTGAVSLPLAGLPVVRDIGNFTINRAQGKYQGQYKIAPYEATLNKISQMPFKMVEDWNDENHISMAMELMDLTAMVTGLPGMQMKRTIEGARQLDEGETDDWTRLAFPQ